MPQEVYEPKYVISIAARILGCEIHTLRYYEKLGVVKPYRSGGNIRYYSEADIDQLRHIKALMEDMGVNMAGVEVILKLREKMVEMQRRIDLLEAELGKHKKNR
ncbi:MAG: MerR family transcriptional regulator [Chloroflexi bacterium RBG_16_48_7]|nr:MAG: MerR family transcriptional regulator [Chloroflexi bacterium RBG_16_48_7]